MIPKGEGPLIHVLGAQRSGTNYLVEMIRRHLTENIIQTGDRSICWKHAKPEDPILDQTETVKNAGDRLMARPDVLICLVAKSPIQWASSVLRKSTHDLFIKRTWLLDSSGNPDLPKLMEFYKDFYLSWIDFLEERKRRTGADYAIATAEETCASPLAVLNRLASTLKLPRVEPEQIAQPKRVPYSKPMTEARMQRFLRGEHDLTDDEAARIRIMTGGHPVLAKLGYADPGRSIPQGEPPPALAASCGLSEFGIQSTAISG